MKIKKRAQAWGIDLIIAMMIFIISLTLFYFYVLNQPSEIEENFEKLTYDKKIVSDSILSKGYPEDWDEENVVTIGVLSRDKINETKLERFYNLADTDYEKTKHLFNIIHDYWFFLSEEIIIMGESVEGIGKKPSDTKNLVKITRFTVYKNKPVTAYLYIWE